MSQHSHKLWILHKLHMSFLAHKTLYCPLLVQIEINVYSDYWNFNISEDVFDHSFIVILNKAHICVFEHLNSGRVKLNKFVLD